MHATFEFQSRERCLAKLRHTTRLDRNRNVLISPKIGLFSFENLRFPAAPLCIAEVHSHQVSSKERGLLPAFASLDFNNDVFVIHRIARAQ